MNSRNRFSELKRILSLDTPDIEAILHNCLVYIYGTLPLHSIIIRLPDKKKRFLYSIASAGKVSQSALLKNIPIVSSEDSIQESNQAIPANIIPVMKGNISCAEDACMYCRFPLFSNRIYIGIIEACFLPECSPGDDDLAYLNDCCQLIANKIYQESSAARNKNQIPLRWANTIHFSEEQYHELSILNAISAAVSGTLKIPRMLRKVSELLLSVLPYDGCAVYLADDTNQVANLCSCIGKGCEIVKKLGRSVEFGNGYAGRVCQTGIPIHASNYEEISEIAPHPIFPVFHIKTYSSIPLVAHGKTIGAINLISIEQHQITVSEKLTLESIGHIVGMAIENSLQYERIRARSHRERIINIISRDLRKSLDRNEIFSTAVRELGRALKADRCFLAQIENNQMLIKNDYSPKSLSLQSENINMMQMDLPLLEEMKRGNQILIEDTKKDNRTFMIYESFFKRWDIRMAIATPLISSGNLLAFIAVCRNRTYPVWSQEDIRLAQHVVTHTALAFQNALLYERILQSENEYYKLYNDAPDMYQTLNMEGRILICNATLINELGYDSAELIGSHFTDYCTPLSRKSVEIYIMSMLAHQQVQPDLEAKLQRKNGETMDISIYGNPIKENDSVTGIRMVMRNITDQILLQKQLLQAQKMESMGTLAGGIAHDFNNLLTGIMGYAQLIKTETEPGAPSYHYADIIERSGLRAGDITRRLLAFARDESMNRGPTDINNLILDTISLISGSLSTGINLQLDLDPLIPVFQADSVQLEQAILNLCINARDAIGENGSLSIQTTLLPSDQCICKITKGTSSHGCLRIIIRDSGHGIPDDILGRIYDPFFTTKEPGKGTGLGLAMVYNIIIKHQGQIDVETKPGRGTTFYIHIPILSTDMTGEEMSVSPTKMAGHCLVIDDDENVRYFLSSILQSKGLKVTSCINGSEAICYIRNNPHPDICLMDIQMQGLNGMDVFPILKKECPEMRIILTSGYLSEKQLEPYLHSGAFGSIRKPSSPHHILQIVKSALQIENNH
jgi:PAS domain S-box-containing protein